MGLAPFASRRYRNLRVVEQDECPGDGLDVDKMMLMDEISLPTPVTSVVPLFTRF